MRRFVASLLAPALILSTSAASSLHVHQYLGHNHPDHHHGPAAHDHAPPATTDRDHHGQADAEDHAAWQADPCEPGRHAVAVTIGCASVPQVSLDFAELPGPIVGLRNRPIRSAVPFTDVRVHGPPFDPGIPSRAPPPTPHA